MNAVRALRDHYLRVDARSLGLFRWLFGLALIGDLFARWRWLKDFYSNEGVLPNHNHLFLLRETRGVWSLYNPFSSPAENHVAFALTLLVYVCFAAGHHTRVFHALALACVVSLAGRNILLENAGNYAAIALCAFTLFLPCGSRFSVDALRASRRVRAERGEGALDDREAVLAGRLPGWSPASLAAFAVLLLIALIHLCSALQASGAVWRDGTAFHYALHVDRWVNGLGVLARGAPPSVLAGLSRAFRGVEYAVPVLVALPVPWRRVRELAAALVAAHGLTLALLFSFGIYGYALMAAAALLIPRASWEALERSPRAGRARAAIDATFARVRERFYLGGAALEGAGKPAPLAGPPPALRLWRGVTGSLREAVVAVLLSAMVVQTGQANALPPRLVLRQGPFLAAVAGWPRMLARWDILADPPTEDALVVVDGVTKDGREIDPLTGAAPVFEPSALRGTGLGQLWNDYFYRAHLAEITVFPSRDRPETVRNEFQRAFDDYLSRSGPRWPEPTGDAVLAGLDVYWLRQPIPPPGSHDPPPPASRTRMLTRGKGGPHKILPPLPGAR